MDDRRLSNPASSRSPLHEGDRVGFSSVSPEAPSGSSIPRVILFGHLVGSEFGGEGYLPRQYFRVLMERKADVWLVAPERSSQDLKKIFPGHQNRIVIVPEGFIERAIWFLLGRSVPLVSRWLLTTIDYWRAAPYLKRLSHEVSSSVLHQVNPVSPRIPLVGWRPDVALIVGPLSGPTGYPAAFRHLFALARSALLRVRRAVHNDR